MKGITARIRPYPLLIVNNALYVNGGGTKLRQGKGRFKGCCNQDLGGGEKLMGKGATLPPPLTTFATPP